MLSSAPLLIYWVGGPGVLGSGSLIPSTGVWLVSLLARSLAGVLCELLVVLSPSMGCPGPGQGVSQDQLLASNLLLKSFLRAFSSTACLRASPGDAGVQRDLWLVSSDWDLRSSEVRGPSGLALILHRGLAVFSLSPRSQTSALLPVLPRGSQTLSPGVVSSR